MSWMPIRHAGDSSSNYVWEVDKGNLQIGLLMVFDDNLGDGNNTYTIDVLTNYLNSPNEGGVLDSIYFDYPQYADEWDDSDEHVICCWRVDTHSEGADLNGAGDIHISKRGGHDTNPEYDWPNTLGCLICGDDIHFGGLNKGGVTKEYSVLPLTPEKDLIMYSLWFYNDKLRPDETLPKHSRDEMLEDGLFNVRFSDAGSPTSRVAARVNIYTFTNTNPNVVNQFEYYQMEVAPDYRLNIPSSIEANIKNDHIGIVIDSLYDYPILMNRDSQTGRFEMTFEGGVGFSNYLSQIKLTLESWGITPEITDIDSICSVFTRRYWLEITQTPEQSSGTMPGFNIIIHGDTHDINPEFITSNMIDIDCDNLNLKIESVTHVSSTEQGDHTICIKLIDDFGVDKKEYIMVKLLGEYAGYNFIRGTHSGGTTLNLLKFNSDTLTKHEELNNK